MARLAAPNRSQARRGRYSNSDVDGRQVLFTQGEFNDGKNPAPRRCFASNDCTRVLSSGQCVEFGHEVLDLTRAGAETHINSYGPELSALGVRYESAD